MEAGISFTLLTQDFTDGIHPEEQQKITFKNKKYRIKEVRHDGSGAMLRLICEVEHKGI
jgi:hypothetical protein